MSTTAASESKSDSMMVGGEVDHPCFALLDGFVVLDNNSNQMPADQWTRVRVPIDRLPATLGRTHVVPDGPEQRHFFGVGKTNVKAMSRQHMRIEYRISSGSVGQLLKTQQSSSKPEKAGSSAPPPPKEESLKPIPQTNADDEFFYQPSELDYRNPNNTEVKPLQGFFVVTCLGKNALRVDGTRVEQHQSCIISHGSAIKASGFCLYFLLPEGSEEHPQQTAMLASSDGTSGPAALDNHLELASISLPSGHKRKQPGEVNTTTEAPIPDTIQTSINSPATKGGPTPPQTSSNTAVAPPAKRAKGNAWTSMQEQLDAMTTEDLLQQLFQAVDRDIWDRRCQFMGATVAYRAVREAAYDPRIQTKALEGGLSKVEIVNWIDTSDRFAEWATLMQKKLEPKSYQSSISKAMARAGYERVNNKNFGRHVRWVLPPDVEPSGTKGSPSKDDDENQDASEGGAGEEEEDAGENEEQEEDGDGEEDGENEQDDKSDQNDEDENEIKDEEDALDDEREEEEEQQDEGDSGGEQEPEEDNEENSDGDGQ